MAFEDILKKYFNSVYTEIDFVKKTYAALNELGFSDENSIASTCICRDEISQSLRSIIKHMWGEAFNLSSLGGMFFAGQTGLAAAMHHAPNVEGRERYVYYALPHIAIDKDGRLGACMRTGREEESAACGALVAFQKEMTKGSLNLSMDDIDLEQNLLKRRLLREIPYGHIPDLLELTKITQKVIQKDLEHAINTIIDKSRSDYAILTGIQIHGPDANYVGNASGYVVVHNVREEIIF
ncbi:MAG: hypothetical protein HY809_08525 [Nitrospirae bacterium]|nr:hypothetical protein [Nitrospirota bacterium]